MSDWLWHDAISQAQAIRQGELTSAELADYTLDQIERLNPRLRAYVSVDTEGARAAAREADEILRRVGRADVGPLHGVTISFKDVDDVAGLPTTHSSEVLADKIASDDAPIVRRCKQAGLVVLGKTNLPEFQSSMTTSKLNGICRNPWDEERTSGGSSGGAGAALAAGMCSVAHGTDGAGSVRVPASFCGLLGLKPTRRLVSFGPQEDPPYFGTNEPGILAHSVRDLASMLDVMTGAASSEPQWGPRGPQPYREQIKVPSTRLRIAVTTEFPYGSVAEECAGATTRTGEILASLGHSVDVAAPDWMPILQAPLPLEVPGPGGLVRPDQFDLVEPRNRPMVARLAAMTILEHSLAVERTRTAARQFLTFWDRFDVLLSPTCGIIPPPVSFAPWDQTPEEHAATFSSFALFTHPFNISGQPAISVPAAWSGDGLPVGVQIAGRPLSEGLLLQLAAELEQAVPWADRRPAAIS